MAITIFGKAIMALLSMLFIYQLSKYYLNPKSLPEILQLSNRPKMPDRFETFLNSSRNYFHNEGFKPTVSNPLFSCHLLFVKNAINLV